MTPSDIAGLSERMRSQITSDHVRGCQGRNYSCDCGYDLSTEGLLDLAATALDSLSARVNEADEACQRLCGAHGFATGHGDSVADMIDEISAQIGERLNEVRHLASGPEGGSVEMEGSK